MTLPYLSYFFMKECLFMDDFINNFVQYEGISPKLPSKLSCFKYLSHPFFIELPTPSTPIYTLNKVSVRINSFGIDSTAKNWQFNKSGTSANTLSFPIFLEAEATLYYTTCDLIHSIHSVPYHFSILNELTYTAFSSPRKNLRPNLYVEDIFAYCPDTTHIYGHISLLATLPI